MWLVSIHVARVLPKRAFWRFMDERDLVSAIKSTALDTVECVFYSPELDMLDVSTKESGFMFKDEYGPFHLKYFINDHIHPLKTYRFDFIGEL